MYVLPTTVAALAITVVAIVPPAGSSHFCAFSTVIEIAPPGGLTDLGDVRRAAADATGLPLDDDSLAEVTLPVTPPPETPSSILVPWPNAYLGTYVVVDSLSARGFWVYAEANGVPGLQRGGTTVLGDEDPCRSRGPPDFAIV